MRILPDDLLWPFNISVSICWSQSFSAQPVNKPPFPAQQFSQHQARRTELQEDSFLRENNMGWGPVIFLHWLFFFVLVKDKACVLSIKSKTKAPAGGKSVLNPLNQTAQFPLFKLISCQPAFAVQAPSLQFTRLCSSAPCLLLVDTPLGGQTFRLFHLCLL